MCNLENLISCCFIDTINSVPSLESFNNNQKKTPKPKNPSQIQETQKKQSLHPAFVLGASPVSYAEKIDKSTNPQSQAEATGHTPPLAACCS